MRSGRFAVAAGPPRRGAVAKPRRKPPKAALFRRRRNPLRGGPAVSTYLPLKIFSDPKIDITESLEYNQKEREIFQLEAEKWT